MIKAWVYEATCHAKFSHSEQLLKFLTVILDYLVHWLKDRQSGHTKIPTVWLCICCDAEVPRLRLNFSSYIWRVTSCYIVLYCIEEKILQQNAFAYDNWSVSHFLRVTSPNVHRLINCFTSKLNNKFVLKLSLNSPPHLKYVATLPCDLLLITMNASNFCYFPIRMFHKVVQRHP